MKLHWHPREPPLPEAVGALAQGAARDALLRRLCLLPAEVLNSFQGVGNEALVLVLGPSLPWVDGLHWLGVDPEAPALLLPTTRRPDLPLSLLQARLGHLGMGPGPWALLPGLIVPTGHRRPLDLGVLQDLLGGRL